MQRSGVVWRTEERLAAHLPRRTGGRCDVWVVVHDPEALGDVLSAIKDEGLSRTVLGMGSRVIVRDGGLAGAVMRLGQGYAQVQVDDEGVTAGAAVPLARIGVAAGEGPLSCLRRQPGSLGASLKEDTGWGPYVQTVDVYDRGGVRTLSLEDARKRGSAVFVGARLRWQPEGGGRRTLPGRERPWSVLAEVPKADVARLLAKAGLAGTRLRDVVLPAAEPTSLTNLGTASARDIDLLLRSVADRMKRERGVELKTAIQWLGRVS